MPAKQPTEVTPLASSREVVVLSLVTTEQSARDIAAPFRKGIGRNVANATLYGLITQLSTRGWISIRNGNGKAGDKRLRYIRITPAGLSALKAAGKQHRRLADLVDEAVARRSTERPAKPVKATNGAAAKPVKKRATKAKATNGAADITNGAATEAKASTGRRRAAAAKVIEAVA